MHPSLDSAYKLPIGPVAKGTRGERSMIHGEVEVVGEELKEELDPATQNSNKTRSLLELSLPLLQLF